MPSFTAHVRQAGHNKDMLAFLADEGKRKEYSDWYVTICFYAALHHLEALIFKIGRMNICYEDGAPISYDGKHAKDFKSRYGTQSEHVARLNLIRDNPEYFVALDQPFGNLYEMSRTARYSCWECDDHNHAEAHNLLGSIEGSFQDIMRAIERGS